MPHYLTKSGYIAHDVQEELVAKVLSFDAGKDLETVCHWTAELVCSGRARQVLRDMIRLYSTRYINKNIGLTTFLASKIAVLQQERFRYTSDRVRAALNDIVVVLAEQRSSRSERKMNSQVQRSIIETLYLEPTQSTRAAHALIKLLGDSVIDYESFNWLCHLWQNVRSDSHTTFCLLDYLTTIKAPLPSGCNIECAQQCRNDGVWALWAVARAAAKHTGQMQSQFVDACFSLYKCDFSKQVRDERSNLLYASFLVCGENSQELVDRDPYSSTAKEATRQVYTLYAHILGKPPKSPPQTKPSQTKPPKKKSQHPPPQSLDGNKLKYLFVYTYATDTPPPLQSRKPQEYKNVVLNCNTDNTLTPPQNIEILKINGPM